MAGFTANAHLAAMAQRAASVLRSNARAITPGGGVAQIPVPQQAPPTTFRTGNAAVSQLGGLARMSAATVAALRQSSGYLPNSPERMQLQQASLADAMGQNDISDFTRGFMHGISGSDEAYRAWAQQHAPSYGGQQFYAHNIAQEGQTEIRNGVVGRLIKFTSPGQGSSTEWVPDPDQGPPAPAAPPGQYWW